MANPSYKENEYIQKSMTIEIKTFLPSRSTTDSDKKDSDSDNQDSTKEYYGCKGTQRK